MVIGWTKSSCEDKTHGVVKVLIKDNACTGFIERERTDHSSTISFGMRISGTVLASRDERTVVAIQNHLSGSIDENGVFETDNDSEHDPYVVLIYRDGQRIGAYRLTEILHRPRMVRSSKSCGHRSVDICPRVHWLLHYGGFEQSEGRKLTLHTTSLRQVTLNLQNGKI